MADLNKRRRRVNWKWLLVDDATQPPDMAPLWAPAHIQEWRVGEQANTACLWGEVDPDSPMRWYRILVVSTGDDVPEHAGRLLGMSVLTHAGRRIPATRDNSVQHFYLVDEDAEAAAAALALPLLGLGENVLTFPHWRAANALAV
jgi:hypothetical protein